MTLFYNVIDVLQNTENQDATVVVVLPDNRLDLVDNDQMLWDDLTSSNNTWNIQVQGGHNVTIEKTTKQSTAAQTVTIHWTLSMMSPNTVTLACNVNTISSRVTGGIRKGSNSTQNAFSFPLDISKIDVLIESSQPLKDLKAVKQDFMHGLNETNTKMVQNIEDESSTENRKVAFQDESLMSIRYLNDVLWYIYMVLALVLVVLLLTNRKYSNGVIGAISIGLVIWPYVVDYIELLIYRFIRNVYALITGVVYVDV